MCYEVQVDEAVSNPHSTSSSVGAGSSNTSSKNGGAGSGGRERLRGKCGEGINVLGMITLSDLDRLDAEGKTGRGWIACE
jgi:hypothetical protein